MPKIRCYLRTRRKEWRLTQDELANLVGSYREKIRDVEGGLALPTADQLIACAFIFNRTPAEIFPSYVETVQDAVMAAANRLSEDVENDKSPEGRRKRELLQKMLTRVTSYVDYV